MDASNISLHRPASPRSAASTAQPDIKQYRKPTGDNPQAERRRDNTGSLELYGGTGKTRTARPTVRGNNIDITV